ncbi:unnamed protein product [Moneuplotes crassus]|uniref:Uncharacterized protein n=1 Tax=Euplotes crassus TaxID=5936 RepID=A0AAD1Y3N0_EUPCR|nr:unnamed protein product [Moneuplotes crassus]
MKITKLKGFENMDKDLYSLNMTQKIRNSGFHTRSKTVSEDGSQGTEKRKTIKLDSTKNKNKLIGLIKKSQFNKSAELAKSLINKSKFERVRNNAEARMKNFTRIKKSLESQRKISTESGHRRKKGFNRHFHKFSDYKSDEKNSSNHKLSVQVENCQPGDLDLRDYASKFNYFSKRTRTKISNNLKTDNSGAFRTFQRENQKKLRSKSRENNVIIHHRIDLIREMIEEKELQCLKVYEDCMRGEKKYQYEFLNTIKEYNIDLIESFNEIKDFQKPPMDLIQQIILSLNSNYGRFENFHKLELLYKNKALEKANEDYSSLEKSKNIIYSPDQEMSSFE